MIHSQSASIILAVASALISFAPQSVSASVGSFDVPHLSGRASSPSYLRRRHHAKLAARRNSELAKKQSSTLFSGAGQATLYFDINGGGTCGAVNGWSFFAETGGIAMCEPSVGYKTLAQRGSNMVVALPVSMMSAHKAEYCGKEVIAHYKGKTISGLIAWDGCAACDGNGGLDFSSTVFGELVGEANCGAGRLDGLTWEITNNQLWSAETGDPVSGTSSSGSSNDDDDGSSSNWSSSSSSSSWVEETASSASWTPESTPEATPSSTWSSPSEYWSSSSSWSASSSSDQPAATGKFADPKNAKGVFSDSNNKQLNVETTSPSTSSSSSSSSVEEESVAEPTSSASATENEEPVEPTEVASTAQPESTTEVVPEEATTHQYCNDTPGQWKCVGNTLQQCVQTPDNWSWLERASCKRVINCDSPNPVCIN